MKKLTANFYPALEEKNGYIGKADITIANAIRINDISVFRKEDSLNIDFPGYGDDGSYVVPQSKEAYAAMLEVVEMAVNSDKHFGYNRGEYGIRLNVTGKLVQEPLADGRFSVSVGDVCTLYGITTRPVTYMKDDKENHFISVDLPTSRTYEKDGETQYQTAFEGRNPVWKDKNGQEQSRNYGQLLQGLVLGERKALLKERKPALDDQVKEANGKKAPAAKKTAPKKEQEATR